MFFLISGFLFGYLYIEKGKYRQAKVFLNNKAKRLLIPYLFWGSILIVAMPMVHISWINLFTGPAHLWFLLVLFQLFIIIYVLVKYDIITKSPISKKSMLIDWGVFLLSFLPLYLWRLFTNHHYFLCIEETFYYLPVFILGFYLAKYYIFINNNNNWTLFYFIVGVICLVSLSIKEVLSNNSLYRVPSILVAYSSFALCKYTHLSKTKDRIILFIDQHSMGIYLFNQIVIFQILLIPSLNLLFRNYPCLGLFCLLGASSLIPLTLSWIFQKFRLLSWMIGGIVN